MNNIIYCQEDCECLDNKEAPVCKKYGMKLEKHFPNTVKCFPCRNNREEA